MLIRVRGDVSGIVEYLEKGRKSGREHSRDELDERLILAGDLAVTDTVINSIEAKGDRYKHITLSFKEDEISSEVLHAIVDEFRSFALSAYRDEEINFYAEAHLPRIKSYSNARTGEFVERKPHIHIVVPKVNLLSWTQADPFGYYDFSERHLAAFQQHINDKYGLSDPQDNRRAFTATAAETISRYKGDEFTGGNKDIRMQILDSVLERNIQNREDFHALVSTLGAVKIRNAGTSREYLNLKVADAKKGINLSDGVFSMRFLSLSKEEKLAFLTSENVRRYETAGAKKKTTPECEEILHDWRELRAREAKYINSGNRTFYAQYRAMSREQKVALLADREAAFYVKHLGIEHEQSSIRNQANDRAAAFERIGNNLESATANLATARGFAGRFDQGARNVANRSALRAIAAVVGGRGRNQTPHHAEPEREAGQHAASSLIGRYRHELDEGKATRQAGKQSEFAEIKQRMQAGRLLSHLARSHGLIPEKYEITQAQDGSERIKCGSRHLNVSDFLTKEMNLPWKEAAPILRDVYAHQIGQTQQRPHAEPHAELWKHFKEWKAETVPTLRSEANKSISTEHARSISQARKEYTAACSRIEGDRTITKEQAKLLKDIAKAERTHKQIEARNVRDGLRKAYREQFSAKGDQLYRRFLAEAAQGDQPYAEAALVELRKRAPDVMEKEDAAQYIRAADTTAAQQAAPIRRDLTYKVDTQGHVTYKIDGREALKDEGQRVKVLQVSDSRVIEEGLALARAKFGKKITLHGTDDFKAQVVAIAVSKNMDVEFNDPQLQRMKHELTQQREERARQLAKGRQALADAAAKKQQGAKIKAEHADTEKGKEKPIQKQGEKPMPVREPVPANAEQPAHAVPGSQAPYKAYGTYTGEIIAMTDTHVYQQTKYGTIHHPREQFKKDAPEVGQVLSIRYNDHKITHYKPIEREREGLGR